MDDLTTLKGMVKGMEIMGAKFVRVDGDNIFFNIPNNSEISDKNKLKKAKDAFIKMFKLNLKEE